MKESLLKLNLILIGRIKELQTENKELKELALALMDSIHKMETKFHKGFGHESPF